MNGLLVPAAAALFVVGFLGWRRAIASSSSASSSSSIDAPTWILSESSSSDLSGGYTPQDLGFNSAAMPPPDTTQADRNERAFLRMIYAAEGTDKEGGYGALFGWPASGRSFDPYTVASHPKVFFSFTDKAGNVRKTSAAGAPQITYTTWSTYYVPFKAWAALNGRPSNGFTPDTQDSFALFLLDLDGALPLVRAGRLAEAVAIARRRWASLPGAGYDQPERSQNFIVAAYKAAGGTIA